MGNPRIAIFQQKDLDALQSLRDYAECHETFSADLLKMANGEAPPIGDNVNHVRTFQDLGIRLVFNIEEQPYAGWCRHLSVSVSSPEMDKAPSEELMEFLMKKLGFGIDPAKMVVYVEQRRPPAVNVVEQMTKPV